LEGLGNAETEVLVIDEVGFGTKDLTHYAYSLVGTPVLYETNKKLLHNLTCIATISTKAVEFL
jgi:hypothetical protein